MRLSEHFTLSELTRSRTAAIHDIDMTPPPAVLENLNYLVTTGLQPIREVLGAPVIPTNAYRPPALNCLVGGAMRRDDLWRLAVDVSQAEAVRDAANQRYHRGPWHNTNSRHMAGLAVDFVVVGFTPFDAANIICQWSRGTGFAFHKLILEFNQWLHFSINAQPVKCVSQGIFLSRTAGEPDYQPGLIA